MNPAARLCSLCAQAQLTPAYSSQISGILRVFAPVGLSEFQWAGGGSQKRFPKPLFLRLDLFSNHLIQGHQTASLGRLSFREFSGGTSYRFCGQRTSTVSPFDIRPDTCSCAFFAEQKALTLGLSRHTWSGAVEIGRQFRLLVHAGRVELGLRQARD